MSYVPIRHFSDIEAWKMGREVRKSVYQVVGKLPEAETYALGSQMRRAAVSITANIAEGYGRYHYNENIQYCRQSRGSLYEIQDHLLTCLDESYISKEEYEDLLAMTEKCAKLLNGYISMLQKRRNMETGNKS